MGYGQFMLKDRNEAGLLLAEKLKDLKIKNPLILAIPRGGVMVAYEIAKRIGAELDIVTPRKLKDKYDPELAIGAVMPDGSTFLNEEVIAARGIEIAYIEKEKELEINESLRRLNAYRGIREYPKLNGRIVILVDDGIATGATAIAAIKWIRKHDPKKIIVAVPVIAADILDKLRREADDVIYLNVPELFFGIGQFYREFEQVEDGEVIKILDSYWKDK